MSSQSLWMSLVAGVILAASPSPSAQQIGADPSYSDLEVLSVNVLVSGLGAGVAASLDGRSFWRAALQGASGGAVMFFGKRIASSDFDAMGLIGREVSAVGASISRNVALGSPPLDTLSLPVGPLWMSWSITGRRFTNVRVDTEGLAWTAYRLADDRYELDRAGSLRAGAFVFTTREQIRPHDWGVVGGLTRGGTVVLSETQLLFSPRNRHHELIHVAQVDYLKIAFGTPLERRSLKELGWEGGGVLEHIALGLAHYPLQGLLRSLLEAEAERFEVRHR